MTPAKILVVDDEVELERLIRQRFRKKIQAKELDFLFATDGKEALDRLQADSQVDMVLTDINMPAMDGLTLLTRLAEIDQTLKAVVISAYGDMHNIRKAMNRGAFDFLTKPIDFQDLEVTIHKTLEFVKQIRDSQQHQYQTRQDLLQAAYHDTLTGLPNRRWLMQRLAQLLEPSKEEPNQLGALLFIDLNGFKQVNDTLGHQMGDILLEQVARRLQNGLRGGDDSRGKDEMARLGGDEFVIVVEGIADRAKVLAITRRLQNQLQQPFNLQGHLISIGASVGIALNDQPYQSPEELLRDADTAMYFAKTQGLKHFAIFNPIMRPALVSRGFDRKEPLVMLGVNQGTEPSEAVCLKPVEEASASGE